MSGLRAAFVVMAGVLWMGSGTEHARAQAPVLVELFTSEGCSSCPPADALLAQIAGSRRDVIVLSEHVDYWNSLGWRDPYSSSESTTRQTAYAGVFGGEGPYTPQAVVNGKVQFVGSDRAAMNAALDRPGKMPTTVLTLTPTPGGTGRELRAHVHLGSAAAGGTLFAVLVQNEGVQHVARGENGGRTLRHVSIAREWNQLAQVARGSGWDGMAKFDLPDGATASGYHLVVFLQASAGGPVVAVASS